MEKWERIKAWVTSELNRVSTNIMLASVGFFSSSYVKLKKRKEREKEKIVIFQSKIQGYLDCYVMHEC